MKASNTLIRSVAAVLSGRTLVRLLGIIYTPILVRLLSKEGYGTYAVFIAIFTTSAVFAKGGLFSSVRKHVAEFPSGHDEQSRLVATGSVLSVIYAVIVALFAVALSVIQSPQLQAPVLFLLAVAILARNPYEIFRSAFYGRQQEGVSEKLDVVRKIIYIVLALSLAWFGFGVFGVFVGYTMAYIVITPIAGWLVFRNFDVGRFLTFAGIRPQSRRVIRFGGVQMVGALAAILLYRTDILLIEYFRPATAAATYQAALVPAELVWFIPSAIQAALLQDVAGSWAEGKIEQINQTLHSSLKYAILSLTLLAIGLFGLAEEFLTVYYGPNFIGAATPLRILLIGTFFYGINRVYVSILQATGRLSYDTMNMIAALAINVILNVILIPRYGIEGAAIGTAISYASVFIGSLIILRFTEFSPFQPTMAVRLLLTVGLFGAIYLTVLEIVSLGTLLSLLVFPVFGALLFVGIAIGTGSLEITTLRELLARIASGSTG